MSFIGKNIKKIRTVKKLSQAAFAEIFNLARPSVGAYEEGRAEPKIENIVQIAQYFGLSVDVLLNKELTINDLYKFNVYTEGFKKGDPAFSSEKKSANVGISMVMVNQYLEYIVNHQNKDFISKLRKINLPMDFSDTARAFQVNGSEMEYNHNGLHHGDILLCTLMKSITKRKIIQGKVYVIVTKENIITRRMSGFTESLELISDDPNYPLLKIKKTDILELWKVQGVYSTYLNPPTALESRIIQIENEIEKLKGK